MANILSLIRSGALFFVNHSGGKDSQTMYIRLKKIIPENQIVVIHATLGRIEWPGTIDHIESTIKGSAFETCTNEKKDFLSMVESRGKFPDIKRKQCTSDLKRDPLEKKIRAIMKMRGALLAVNCMGIRAEESCSRSKAKPFRKNNRLSKAGRTVYDWLPIHKMSTEKVFLTIAAAGEQPHWAYSKGMTRLSCSFCIMGCKSDLKTAAKLRPELYAEYVNLEKKIGHTLQMDGKPLTEITGIAI